MCVGLSKAYNYIYLPTNLLAYPILESILSRLVSLNVSILLATLILPTLQAIYASKTLMTDSY